jgi:ElaB/YqjD/DUF883 family membrane-anchored ribosome-binding protein
MSERETSQTEPTGEPDQPRDPEALRGDIERTRAELGDTVEALSHKADVKTQVAEKVEERKADLRGRQESIRARATEVRGRVSDATPDPAKRAASQVAHTAEQRPFPAIGLAIAVGLLLGWLLGRR